MASQNTMLNRHKRLTAPVALSKGDGDRITGFEKKIKKIEAKKHITKNDKKHIHKMQSIINNIRKPVVTGRTRNKVHRLEKKLGINKAEPKTEATPT